MHEMLFKCNDCGRSFASRHAATVHIKKIHLVKDRDLFVCIICNAAYGRSLFLAQHMKTHGQLGNKEELVQQLMEMSCETTIPVSRPTVRRTGRPKKKK
jgi:DNA-directed RNA polymerase subunit RPC12/RpoP